MSIAKRLLLVPALYLFFMGTIPEARTQDRGAKTGTISGRVLDVNGRAIGGARVIAYPQIANPRDKLIEQVIVVGTFTRSAPKPPAEAVSAGNGSYRIEGLEKKYYALKTVARGFTPAERPDILPTLDRVNFRLSPGGRLCGEVVDGAGGALSGIKVMAYVHVDSNDLFSIIESRSRPPFETVKTGAGGEFCLEMLGTGTYHLVAAGKGYQEGRLLKVALGEGENPRQRLTLSRGLVIAGTVVSATNEPVAGARIRASRLTDKNQPDFFRLDDGSISTDAQGRFRFDTLEPGRYLILAYHPDHASEMFRDIEAGTGDLTIALPAGGTVQGTVTESGTRKPIAGARIWVNEWEDLRREGVTDASGVYSIRGLNTTRRSSHYLNLHAPGYARISNVPIEVRDGRVLENQDFDLERTASVSGRVVNSAREGVPGARVKVRRKAPDSQVPITLGEADTGDDGRYLIGDLEAGEDTMLWIVPVKGYLEPEGTAPFSLEPGESLEVPEILLQRGGTVKGVILGPDGRGIEGVEVLVRRRGETEPDTGFSAISALSDSDGRFLIQGLPGGVIDLIARSAQYLEEVRPGVRAGDEVKLVLRRGGRIGGQVLDAAGRPVRDARVVAHDISAAGFRQVEATTDREGRFLVEKILATGRIEVEVHHPQFARWSNEQVEVNTGDLKVVLGNRKK